MESYISRLSEAVNNRHSHRDYLPEEIKTSEIKQLEDFIHDIKVPFEHDVEISLYKVPEGRKVVYFKGPKDFAAFISGLSIISQAKLGFVGELFILFCQSIQLKTCWMGHYNKEDTIQIVYQFEEKQKSRKVHCITPIGYTPEKTSFLDRMSTNRFSKKNKTIEDFLHPNSLKEFPSYISHALELATKAPSAMNTQNWYFLVTLSNDTYTIELSKPKGYQHLKWHFYDIDVGTAASHIWIGLKEQGLKTKIDISDTTGDVIWRFIFKK
jgi:nitroreductase